MFKGKNSIFNSQYSFSYIFPLVAIIIVANLPPIKNKIYSFWLLLALLGLPFASLFQLPNRVDTISQLSISAQALKPIIAEEKNIIWLTEPMSLYLAGRISYYPLINSANFFKPASDTNTVAGLGFWNQAMLDQWLAQSTLFVIDENNLKSLELKPSLYQLTEIRNDIWPGSLYFFKQ